MDIREPTEADIEAWAELRALLWPEGPLAEHRDEALAALSAGDPDRLALLAIDPAGVVCGFAEAALRHDYVNGCETSPVAFLEGVFVSPGQRGRGAGRALGAAVEAWGRRQGCRELASDALIDNRGSHAFHRAIGFQETERVVYFRKALL